MLGYPDSCTIKLGLGSTMCSTNVDKLVGAPFFINSPKKTRVNIIFYFTNVEQVWLLYDCTSFRNFPAFQVQINTRLEVWVDGWAGWLVGWLWGCLVLISIIV